MRKFLGWMNRGAISGYQGGRPRYVTGWRGNCPGTNVVKSLLNEPAIEISSQDLPALSAQDLVAFLVQDSPCFVDHHKGNSNALVGIVLDGTVSDDLFAAASKALASHGIPLLRFVPDTRDSPAHFERFVRVGQWQSMPE